MKKKKKWLPCFNYNPYNSLLEHHRNEIQAQLNIFCKKYEHLLIMGDFCSNISESTVSLSCTQSWTKYLCTFYVLTKFLSTTSESEQDYYH